MTLVREILVDRRNFFINEVKAPLYAAIKLYSKKYPEPTHENVRQPNSHLLIDIFDEVMRFEKIERVMIILEAAKRLIIGEYEHDGVYRGRMDVILEKIVELIVKGEWKPRQLGKPSILWSEAEESKIKGMSLYGKIARMMRHYQSFTEE